MNLNALSSTRSAVNVSGRIRPLPFWKAIFFFALPALGFRLAIYAGMLALIVAGLSQYEAFIVSFAVPSAVLFALAFGFFKEEGNPSRLNWNYLG